MLYYCKFSFRELSLRLISLSNFPDSESLPYPTIPAARPATEFGPRFSDMEAFGYTVHSLGQLIENVFRVHAREEVSRLQLLGCLRRYARRRARYQSDVAIGGMLSRMWRIARQTM